MKKLRGRKAEPQRFVTIWYFQLNIPGQRGLLCTFFHIDLNLFVPSSFSMEPRSSSKEGTVPVTLEMQINRA